MKKLLIVAAAILTLGACTQNEELFQLAENQEIKFQVANYAINTRALSGNAFTYDSFGVYAWSASSVGAYYMDNETVTLQGGEWKPSTTYYWPKSATVDFISYYPRTEATNTSVKIEPAAITYTAYQVGAATVGADGTVTTKDYDKTNDLMYADKVVGASNKTNADGNDVITTGESDVNYKTVPAYFHHALAKLNIKIGQSYMTKTVTETSKATTKYKWDVKINSATLKGVDTKGNLALTLSDTANVALNYTYPWTLPDSLLWDKVGTPMSDLALGKIDSIGVEALPVLTGLYIMPQSLKEGKQQVTVNMTIVTYRTTDGSEPTEADKFLEETCERTVNLYIDNKTLPSWQINHDITYTLLIAPTAGSGGDDPDPDDPDLKDVEITFDPAVSDWTEVDASATIKL